MERRPERAARLAGAVGWAAIGAFVIAWDLRANETLSHAFKRAQPYSTIALAATAAHLLGLYPAGYDPFAVVFELAKQPDREPS